MVVVNDGVGVVDGNVDVVDGGCVGVVSGGMAALEGVLGCLTRVCVAVSVVLGVTWVPELTGAGMSVVWVVVSTVMMVMVGATFEDWRSS